MIGKTRFFALMAAAILCGCSEKVQEVKKTIDFERISWFAGRANLAYASVKEITDAYPNTVRVTTLKQHKVQYFLEKDDAKKQQIITIRGTVNLKNVEEDAEYIPSRNAKLDIHVHNGFDSSATKLYADVLPYLDKSYTTIVTGHSLGAAISTLLMMYLHEDGFKLSQSINFGQPKVTNKEGAAKYGFLPLLRVIDENDIVPLVPPITCIDPEHGIYEHLGEEVILLEKEFYSYLDKHDAERLSVPSFWADLGHLSLEDHFMDNYIKNIDSKKTTAVQAPYNKREKYIP